MVYNQVKGIPRKVKLISLGWDRRIGVVLRYRENESTEGLNTGYPFISIQVCGIKCNANPPRILISNFSIRIYPYREGTSHEVF